MRRAFGLDIGNKTIGIALSDPLGLTAQGLDTLRRSIIRDDLKRLSELIERYEEGTDEGIVTTETQYD